MKDQGPRNVKGTKVKNGTISRVTTSTVHTTIDHPEGALVHQRGAMLIQSRGPDISRHA